MSGLHRLLEKVEVLGRKTVLPPEIFNRLVPKPFWLRRWMPIYASIRRR
jgi:hypothetical protein